MSDEELTALAAKAFGNAQHGFSPLTDDGDAFRLAVSMFRDIHFWYFDNSVSVGNEQRVVCVAMTHAQLPVSPSSVLQQRSEGGCHDSAYGHQRQDARHSP